MLIFEITIILFLGFMFSKIMRFLKLPDIMGYLFAGVLIGPSFLNLVTTNSIQLLEPLIMIALTLISFQIGSEFKFSAIKKIGYKPFVISIFSSLTTLLLVTTVSLFLNMSLEFSLLLGVILSSTAPAAIMTVVKEYKTTGTLTRNILGVVAIDDIISIILFGLVMAFFDSGSSGSNIIAPLIEIIYSILIGAMVGFVMGKIANSLKENSEVLLVILVSVLFIIFLSMNIHISYMLTATTMGFVFINSFRYKVTNKVLDIIDFISPMLVTIFFVLSGSTLNFAYVDEILIILLFVIIARFIGKTCGSYIAGKFVSISKNVNKYLGLCLLSQTGIAIGLASLAATTLGSEGAILINIVIASSIIFDMIGSVLLKYSLIKYGEIKLDNKNI